jgi:hypothetical protein
LCEREGPRTKNVGKSKEANNSLKTNKVLKNQPVPSERIGYFKKKRLDNRK